MANKTKLEEYKSLGTGRRKAKTPSELDLGTGKASSKRTGPAELNLGTGKASTKSNVTKSNVTKSSVSKNTTGNKTKPKVVTPAMIKAKGFTTLRDYLNNEKGLKRKDGKKVVKTTKTSMPKPPPKAPRGKNKIVPSLKTSSAGIDGGSSQVNKVKKTPKKNVMSTKTPKTYKGTNITPTKLQRDRMRKRAMGST